MMMMMPDACLLGGAAGGRSVCLCLCWSRQTFRELLRSGNLDERHIDVEVPAER